MRAADRLTALASEHKVRVKDLVRQVLPMSPLTGELGTADLAVLERYADPDLLVKAGAKRLTTLIAKASHNKQGTERAAQWLAAAEASLELYDGCPAVAFADLATEIATEARLLRAVQSELVAHAAARGAAYLEVDPGALARSLPGLGEVGGPAVVAVMGYPDRSRRGKQFRCFTGLVPRASETGGTDRKGEPMSKAGSSLLRTTFVRSADTARKQGPPAGPDLLPANGRTRQGPPRGTLRGRGRPGRAGLGRHVPRRALRDPGHRRPGCHRLRGQGHHRTKVDRDRRGTGTAPFEEGGQEGGEGPQGRPDGAAHAERNKCWPTGRPSPPPIFCPGRLSSQGPR